MNDIRAMYHHLSPLGGMLLAVFIMSLVGLVVCGAAMIVQAIRERLWWRRRDPWWVDPLSSGAPQSPCRSDLLKRGNDLQAGNPPSVPSP